MKTLYFTIALVLACALNCQAQIATYNIGPGGLFAMQATSAFGDFCFNGDYEQTTDGIVWGLDWTSTNTNAATSITVEMMYTLEEGNGPYTVSLNGFNETTHNPAANACAYHVQSITFTPTSYNSNAANSLRLDYTPGGQTHYMQFNGAWGGLFYARVLVTYAMPLPIELIDFRAEPIDRQVLLSWETATETNNDFFTLERSADAITWEPIKQQDGAGNSAAVNVYRLFDERPLEGRSYYRLKQTDFDGAVTISNMKIVDLAPQVNMIVYPNPTSDQLTVQYKEGAQLELFDQFGKPQKVPLQRHDHRYVLDTSGLPSGLYLLRATDGKHAETRMVSVVR